MWKNNQSKLDNWVDIKLIPKLTPTIFYIDWNWDRPYPVSPAILLKESIDISKNYYTFQKYISWRDFKSKLFICGNFPKEQLLAPYKFYGNPRIRNKSFLKSHLQKCIRRSKDVEAVKTAFDLMHLDFLMFIRRIIIIMIEDVFLHKSLSTLCWMMVAYGENEWKPSKNHIEWLLGVVSMLGLANKKHEVPRIQLIAIEDYKERLDKYYNKSKKRFTILWCLLLRKNYGGMKCDMNMLNGAFQEWNTIFIDFKKNENNKELLNLFNLKIRAVSVALNSLHLNQYCLEAVDFHCYPEIINQLYYSLDDDIIKENDLSEDKIKDLIWEFSSSYTNKDIVNGKKEEKNIDDFKIWNIIKFDFYKISYEKLKHSYNYLN